METDKITTVLKGLYAKKMLQLERDFKFEMFHSAPLTAADIEAKPIVLLIGQYSVGKTTFIRYLLERDFPGVRIGPEPTTDRFMAVMWGSTEQTIPGNALAADGSRPFTALGKFGMAFLNRFEGSTCPSPILEKLIFVDTPGVLSGEKQRIGRTYNFPEVVEWFAERADRILLLFDAHKLDISDEFKKTIECLRGNDEKIRVVLNKCDMDKQKLMRVYGALMWSLGKVVATPEVLRVYVGNFWEKPLQTESIKDLVMGEMKDLLADLRSLPRQSVLRKVNELVKRGRMLKVHCHILSHLRDKFSWHGFGRDKMQAKLLKGLFTEFKTVQQATGLPVGNFPHVGRFRDALQGIKIDQLPKLKPAHEALLDQLLSKDVNRIMAMLPSSALAPEEGELGASHANPFDNKEGEEDVGFAWLLNEGVKKRYDNVFYALDLNSQEKLGGAEARDVLLQSGQPGGVLKKVWDLADMDQDGCLDCEEFAVAMYLLDTLKSGQLSEPMEELPFNLIPPSKRKFFEDMDEAASGPV